MLFGCQHENTEDEHGSEKHLDEDATADGCSGTKARTNSKWAREDCRNDTSSSYGT